MVLHCATNLTYHGVDYALPFISLTTFGLVSAVLQGGGVPSRPEAPFRQRGWRVKAACFRRWWRQRDEILAATGSRRRLQRAGRRPVLGEAEDTLVDVIYDRRLKKEKVTRD
ncbi:hypothetical protein C6341_g10386 [Phytophthora cactorum]|nr:hypothetical protein C6341_g10386 [Phytophthora cactorum]